MMTLASTSETPSAIAAVSPGAAGRTERKVKNEGTVMGIVPDAYAAAARAATR
jgi:hypothetical protein